MKNVTITGYSKEGLIRKRYAVLLMLIFGFITYSSLCKAQMLDSIALAKEPVYIDLKFALKTPDKVYKLNLRKKRLKEIPKEVFTLTNLQELNLSKNKLKRIPKEISALQKIEVLNLSANKIDSVCPDIGQLVQIKRLILNQNEISSLPSTIGNLKNMYFLDLWGNSILHLPDEIAKLKNTLKVVDMRVIGIKDDLQEEMTSQLPYTKFYFSMDCNCN